jgi:hypothetical protein
LTVLPLEVHITPTTLTIAQEGIGKLTASVVIAGTDTPVPDAQITWTTSNPDVALLVWGVPDDYHASVSGVKAGEAEITATVTAGPLHWSTEGSAQVTVSDWLGTWTGPMTSLNTCDWVDPAAPDCFLDTNHDDIGDMTFWITDASNGSVSGSFPQFFSAWHYEPVPFTAPVTGASISWSESGDPLFVDLQINNITGAIIARHVNTSISFTLTRVSDRVIEGEALWIAYDELPSCSDPSCRHWDWLKAVFTLSR